MQTSKLWNAIKELGEVDAKRLSPTIDTPLFNGKKYHRHAFNIIYKAVTGNKVLSRENLSDKIFGRNNYDDVKMRLIMSDLLKIIEQYIVMQSAIKDNDYSDIALLKFYRENGNHKLFKSTLNSVVSRKEKATYQNEEHYESLTNIAIEKYTFISTHQRSEKLNLRDIHSKMDVAYIARKLRYSCFALIHGTVSGQHYDTGMTPEIIRFIESTDLMEVPVIETYYYCHSMVSNPDDLSVFQTFRKKIASYAHLFPDYEMRSLYLLAINQCIRKLNDGNLKFGSVGIDLYQKALEGKYLLINGHLSRFTYRNVVAMAIKTGDFKWAEEFSHSYKDFIRRDQKESAFHFNMALIYYQKKAYDIALDNLLNVDFKDNLLNLAVKTLQMKIYLESDKDKLLYSHLDAMEMYLLRMRVIGYHKQNYKNIIRYTKKLVKVNRHDAGAVTKLRKEVQEESVLTEKKWILGQLK